MRQSDVINYVIDSFINYKGEEQKFVLCVRTTKSTNIISDVDPDIIPTYYEGFRDLYIGISICNPNDEFNEEIGKKIALGKTKSYIPKLVATEPGIINNALVQALIKQEVTFIKNNPGKFIAGYDEAKRKYEAKINLKEEIKNLTNDEALIVEAALNGANLDKCKEITKKVSKSEYNKARSN